MNNDRAQNTREIAQQAINALDALFERLEGGEGFRTLVDARGALSVYIQSGVLPPDTSLAIKPSSVGGVTLVRGGQHFTINDDELEAVRDAVNARKREIRKRERRQAKAQERERKR